MTAKHPAIADPNGPALDPPVVPTPEARWYCLSREGLATLCKCEEDALRVAAESRVMYPRNGPYRAVQMVDFEVAAAAVAALREVLEFRSATAVPTIHDWGRWRRAADGLHEPKASGSPTPAQQQSTDIWAGLY